MVLTEDEWQELSADLPEKDNPVIQKYLESREALIEEEDKRRSGQPLSIPIPGKSSP